MSTERLRVHVVPVVTLLAARFAQLEAEVMALELTVLRVAGDSRDGRPDPASSILKLRGNIRIPDNRPSDQLGKHHHVGAQDDDVHAASVCTLAGKQKQH